MWIEVTKAKYYTFMENAAVGVNVLLTKLRDGYFSGNQEEGDSFKAV